MTIKKIIIAILLIVIVAALCVIGYIHSVNLKVTTKVEKKEGKKVIYTTFFPVYDLTKRIAKDKFEIKTIIKGDQEPHDFELQTKDMAEISNADLVVYNGASMEGFIDSLKASIKDDSKFLDLSMGLQLLTTTHGEKKAVNPHTWLSPKNAMIQLDTICKKLCALDKKNEAFYKANLKEALNEFKKLDEEMTDSLKNVKSKEKYFVVSHAAFNYLAKDYGLKQVAVSGISPEEEPSAKQLKKIADFTKKNNIKTIFFEGKATPKVARTLAKTTNTKTATLYTMETLNEEERKEGYLGLMRFNIKELVKSFNE